MKKLISNNKIPKRELKKSKFSKVGIKSDEDKIQFDGKKLINLSSNDYLGLSSNKKILNKSLKYLKNYGNSSSSSRLIAGNFNKFEEIETNLSKQLGLRWLRCGVPGGMAATATGDRCSSIARLV